MIALLYPKIEEIQVRISVAGFAMEFKGRRIVFSGLSKKSLDKFGSVKFLQIVDSFANADVTDRNF